MSAYGAAAVTTATVTPETAPLIITYDVADAAGNAARTRRRRVYVVGRCGLGERMCDDDTCSQQGMCPTLQLAEPEAVVNTPPSLHIVGSAAVQVRGEESIRGCVSNGGDESLERSRQGVTVLVEIGTHVPRVSETRGT